MSYSPGGGIARCELFALLRRANNSPDDALGRAAAPRPLSVVRCNCGSTVGLFVLLCSMLHTPASWICVLLVLKAAAVTGTCLRALAGTRIKTLCDAVLFSVEPLLYIPMPRFTFVLFDCTRLTNGDIVLDVDPCLDDAWWGVAPVGVLGLATFVFGVPESTARSQQRRHGPRSSSSSQTWRSGSRRRKRGSSFWTMPSTRQGPHRAGQGQARGAV